MSDNQEQQQPDNTSPVSTMGNLERFMASNPKEVGVYISLSAGSAQVEDSVAFRGTDYDTLIDGISYELRELADMLIQRLRRATRETDKEEET